MNIANIILIISLSIIIILCIISIKRQTKAIKKLESVKQVELKNIFKERWDKEEYELNNSIRLKREGIKNESIKLESDFKLKENEFTNKIKNLQIELNEKEKRYNEVNQDLDLYKKGKMDEINGAAAEYEQRKRQIIEHSIDSYRDQLTEKANQLLREMVGYKEETQKEIEQIQAELEEERNKRAAINEEILRQKKLEEQQDFYRIQLNPDDSNDIELLRSITPRLRHPEVINKVIWTGYYQKPLAELRKRLLTNGDVSGIYKITRLKTNEIYIGQTTSVDKRWQEHVKSALGVGTLASSQLHRVMAADGCENFTFELLEVVPKDKLRERESYYIDFYNSKTYGLNTVSGDKNK